MLNRMNKYLVFLAFLAVSLFLSSCGGIVTNTKTKYSGQALDGEKVTATLFSPAAVRQIAANSSDRERWKSRDLIISGSGWKCAKSSYDELMCDDKSTGTFSVTYFLIDDTEGLSQLKFQLSNGKSGTLKLQVLGNLADFLI